MNKKIYQQPELQITIVEASLPVATSLIINNEALDNAEGDVKANDWNIWDEEYDD